MTKFILGVVLGIVLASGLWALYLAYFIEDAAALGRRLRRWLNTRLKR